MFLGSKFINVLQLVVLLSVASQLSANPFYRLHHSKIINFFKNWWYERHHCLLDNPCKTSLPQHVYAEACLKERRADIYKGRLWYQLTNEKIEKRTEFPFPEIPFLDQNLKSTQFYYAMDPFEGRYISTVSGAFSAYENSLTKFLVSKYINSTFDSPEDFIAMFEDAENAMKKLMVPHVLSNPSQDPSTFTDIVTNGEWMQDDYFVQQILTRDCPFLFKKITKSGSVGIKISELKSVLSTSFSFDDAFAKVLEDDEMTLEKAVEKGIAFVIYNEQMNDIRNSEDFFKGQTGTATLDEITSPIALFVSKNGYLKVVAIQVNATQDSMVLTQSSSLTWLKAKATFFVSYASFCQAYYHGGHYHIVGTVFCASFRRHFATKHPLYILFQYHCEGTIPHIGIAYPSIIFPTGITEKTWAIGSAGVATLSKKAFVDRQFGKLDLPNMIKEYGWGNKETLKYFPFRDDSQLLWNELTKFLNEFVGEVYYDSEDLKEDKELQSFANEVSMDGQVEPDGGKGKFIGFPPKITSKEELAGILRSILWYNVLHTVANYGLAPIFLPFRTSKIYTGENDKFLNFGTVQQLSELTAFRNILINLRVNRIMSYYDKIEDERLRDIVWKSYSRFHGCIQKTLQKRNAMRKSKGMMGMQILEPKWLTNSIHI